MSKHIILFLAANPLDTTQLALGREARAIQEELERSGQRDRFEFVTRWAVQPLDLIRELRKLKPTVVHFSGHGGNGGRQASPGQRRDMTEIGGDAADDGEYQDGLFFHGFDGKPQLVTAAALRDTFQSVGTSVKLVILNACYSSVQAEALLAHIDCVVGISGSLGDSASRAFAVGFYGGLGERQSVAAAYLQGCAAISMEEPQGCEKPQLRVRDGIEANQVVLAEANAVDRGRPIPAYPDAEVEQLSKRLEGARVRRDKLRSAGLGVDHVDREIVELRRQLREGGRLRPGDALGDGRYLLVRVVGRGGFAVVWEAFDCAEQQRVAIKVLHSNLVGDPLRRERFFRGAHAMMKLVHPAVVRVLEPKGEDGGFYYFVMEFVAGENLREWVLQSRLKNEGTLPLILRIGEALALAHSQGMIHRDIKPANILLDEHGVAKLADFDLVGTHDTTGGTRTGALGTVVYAAPECLDRPQEATARADVYGLGMTAIFCLAGQDLSMDTFRNPEWTIDRLRCSIQVRAVLRRAVAWEPHERFADAAALVLKLREVLYPLEHGGAALVDSARVDLPALVPEPTIVSHGVEAGSASVEAAHERHRLEIDDPLGLPRLLNRPWRVRAAGRWWQLAFGVICMVMIANLQYSWTLFALSRDNSHWDRAQIQTAFLILVFLETWLAPVGGWLVDRFGPRAVVVTSSVLCALGWEKSAYANSLPFLFVASGIAGIGVSAVRGTCVGIALKWFPERRGLAVGITDAGFGVGATGTALLLQWGTVSSGYEATFLWFGLGQGAVLFIVGLLLSQPDANAVAALPKPSNMLTNRPQFNSRQMMKTPAFWVMYVMFVLMSAGGLSVTANLKQIAEDFKVANVRVAFLGLGPTALTFALFLDKLMHGLTRPFTGWVSDRIGRENTMFIGFGIESIGILMLSQLGDNPVMFVVLSGVVFFAWGTVYSLFPSTSADTYGWKHAAANAAWLYTARGTAAFLVPFAAGLGASSIGWRGVFLTATTMSGLAAVMALVVLKPLRQPMLRHRV